MRFYYYFGYYFYTLANRTPPFIHKHKTKRVKIDGEPHIL